MVWVWITKGALFLVGKLKDTASGIVGKILATFGLSLVSFEAILPSLKSFVLQYASGLSGTTLQLIGYLNVGVAMSMVLSALTVRMTWKVFLVPTSVANQLGGGNQ